MHTIFIYFLFQQMIRGEGNNEGTYYLFPMQPYVLELTAPNEEIKLARTAPGTVEISHKDPYTQQWSSPKSLDGVNPASSDWVPATGSWVYGATENDRGAYAPGPAEFTGYQSAPQEYGYQQASAPAQQSAPQAYSYQQQSAPVQYGAAQLGPSYSENVNSIPMTFATIGDSSSAPIISPAQGSSSTPAVVSSGAGNTSAGTGAATGAGAGTAAGAATGAATGAVVGNKTGQGNSKTTSKSSSKTTDSKGKEKTKTKSTSTTKTSNTKPKKNAGEGYKVTGCLLAGIVASMSCYLI